MPRSVEARPGRWRSRASFGSTNCGPDCSPATMHHVRGSVRCVADAEVDTRPLGPAGLADLAALFGAYRNTRRCWCMAFCESRTRFGLGWLTGHNRHRFEAMATADRTPMGILASVSNEPVGWCACGPRSRYVVADHGRGEILRGRDPSEDDVVWLLACLFVRPESRNRGVTYALMRSAVSLARREGAVAVEGWPTTGSDGRCAEAFLGRESAFERLGFTCIGRPTSNRAIMRLEVNGSGHPRPR